VVVTAAGGGIAGAQAAARAVQTAGGTVLSSLPLIGGVGADLPVGTTLAPSYAVTDDRPMRLTGAPGDGTGPASTVRETLGLGAPADEGSGVTVAVVDTGVADLPDLAGRLTHVDVSGTGAGDGFGHGTFVAGLVAGSGAASGGRYAGVAPGAHVLDVRVAADDGSTGLLTVLRGLQEVAARDVDVVNLSLSSASQLPYQADPLTVALAALWERGVTVVVPAGNDGPDGRSITSPGVHPALLTVGAVDEAGTAERGDDSVADFSARGPAPQGVDKPDLVAPGRSVVSLRAPGSVVDTENAGARVGDSYFKGSGTSFSTAVTSGAVAALLAAHDLAPDRVKQLLTATAYRPHGLTDRSAAGAGGLDLAAAAAGVAALPVAEPGRRGGGPGKGVRGGQPQWSANSWSGRANSWSANSWSGRANSWSGRANSWSGRANSWSANSWSANSWSANSWGTG
jgi:serine protease AprX